MAVNIQQLLQYEATPAERIEQLENELNQLFRALAQGDMAWAGSIANQMSWTVDELKQSL